MSNVLDDVWKSDTDDGSEEISFDVRKLRENHNKRGYLDGITHSKETNLQQGFDDGFPTGALLGMQVGKLIGTLQALVSKYGDGDEQLSDDFRAARKELHISKVLTKSMFDPNLDVTGQHQLIGKWKVVVKSYCDKYSVNTSL